MPDTSAFAAQFANPALWWNTVQDQFAQAVNQVVTPTKKSARKKSAPKKKATAAVKKTTAPRGTKKAKI
jgi:hypothetical protein